MSSSAQCSSITLATVVNHLFCRSLSHSHHRLNYFLNSILEETLHGTISEIVYIHQSERPEDSHHLETELHVKARTTKQEHLDIYLYVKHETYSNQCQLFEHPTKYEQFTMQTPFQLIKKTYFIKLVNFNLLQEYPHYHTIYRYKDFEAHTALKDVEEMHYLELPKFNDPHLDSPLQRWMALFKHILHSMDIELPLPEVLQSDALIRESYQLISELPIRETDPSYHRSHMNQTGHDQKLLKLGKQTGAWAERSRIATGMIRAGYDYQCIMNITSVTEKQLDQLAMDFYRYDEK
ncbi:MAG: PD-(D/E)XK nuclease family transposase [Bacillota bacterium]